MDKKMTEYFGEVIYSYSEEQAIEDGVLMMNPSNDFEECNIITTNLWFYIEERVLNGNFILTEPQDMVNRLMKDAKDIYKNRKFEGDNDEDFFVVKGSEKIKLVWFVRNEDNKLTAMLPEDY